MKMSMSNQMRMEQRMKLAPRMIQSMEILQLPLLALQERIEAELNSNPVLEEVAETPEQVTPDRNEDDSSENFDEKDLVVKEDNDRAEDFERLNSISDDFDDYMNRSTAYRYKNNTGEPDKKLEALNNTAANSISLHDHLLEQWRLIDADQSIKDAGEAIIDYIDDKGYLSVRLEQLHNKDKNNFNFDHLKQALSLVQTLDPPGVGARDIRECLLIQLRQANEDMLFEEELVQGHLDELLENRLPQIARKMTCSIEQINKALTRLSKLDTSPGLQIGRNENYPIHADVIVEPDPEGDGWTVSLADSSLPSLRVNDYYSRMARDRKLDTQTKEFLQNNIRSAKWLMDAIAQRKNTLLKVAGEVVKHQREFFEKGKLYLKPLPMQTIADAVGVHIATVSRAVAGKYVQCPQGILPLRGFFSGGTEDENGNAQSWDAVRAKLQQIIDNEDKSNPLSDDELRKKLNEEGINNIARRTIAKYRKLLNIPAARFRKKF